MKEKLFFFILITCSFLVEAQENMERKRGWLRTGIVYGFASQNTYLKQDSDYLYENNIFKLSGQYLWSKKRKHAWEILVEPSYYSSKHKMINYWFISHTVENGDELRAKFMPLKSINEYVLNLGIVYRRFLSNNSSLYALGNVGPMYIDTDTERLKKGFAFSDIFALGYNYKMNTLSFDVRSMIRHVSNANLQKPNFGLNSVGFEFGMYYEFL